MLTESIVARGDAEARKHLLGLHLLGSFQMLDGFVDGLDQALRPGEVLLQHLPMRLEGRDLFEVGSAQNLFDLLQLESQLPVKQDLLERKKLRLFVEPVTVRPDIGRLQQPASS